MLSTKNERKYSFYQPFGLLQNQSSHTTLCTTFVLMKLKKNKQSKKFQCFGVGGMCFKSKVVLSIQTRVLCFFPIIVTSSLHLHLLL
jgi:hypothetical protein